MIFVLNKLKIFFRNYFKSTKRFKCMKYSIGSVISEIVKNIKSNYFIKTN